MSRIRTITDFPRNEQGLVDHFLGTAYDVVKAVYLSLDELTELNNKIGEIDSIYADYNIVKDSYEFYRSNYFVVVVKEEKDLAKIDTDIVKSARVVIQKPNGAVGYKEFIFINSIWKEVYTSFSDDQQVNNSFVYNNGSAKGGEYSIKIPNSADHIVTIFVNGLRNLVDDIGYLDKSKNIFHLHKPLEKGDEIVFIFYDNEISLSDFSNIKNLVEENKNRIIILEEDWKKYKEELDKELKEYSEKINKEINKKRDLNDNVFKGYLQVHSDIEGNGTGVFLKDFEGNVRGQVVVTDQGLQLTQYPKEGGLQTFTFPDEGGEVVTKKSSPLITPQMFGAKGDGISDDSEAIQESLDYLESLGGGLLYVPRGTYNLSVGNRHPEVCVIVPSNVKILGEGIDITVFRRNPKERSNKGVLFVSKYWDTAEKFNGAKNLQFSDFTIKDGDPNKFKSSGGGLLAFGHADGVIVERVKGVDFDQHLTDICGCKNVIVRYCISDNPVKNTGSAPFQIDVAGQGIGILGLNKDNTSCENIIIENNIVIRSEAARVIHFHHSQECKNINIRNNFIVCNGESSQYAIGNDGTSYSMVTGEINIENNKIILDNPLSKGIVFTQNTASFFEKLNISNNAIRGKGWQGIFISGGEGELILNNNDINIYKEEEITTASRCTGVLLETEMNLKVSENIIKTSMNYSNSKSTIMNGALSVLSAKNMVIKDNHISSENRYAGEEPNKAVYGFRFGKVDYAEILNNHVECIGITYGISQPSVYAGTKGKMSLNTTIGNYIEANYADPSGLSTGDNDIRIIEVEEDGENTNLITLSSGKEYKIDLPVKKYNSNGDIYNAVNISCVFHRDEKITTTAKVLNNGLIIKDGVAIGTDIQLQSDNVLLIRCGEGGVYYDLVQNGKIRVYTEGRLLIRVGV